MTSSGHCLTVIARLVVNWFSALSKSLSAISRLQSMLCILRMTKYNSLVTEKSNNTINYDMKQLKQTRITVNRDSVKSSGSVILQN